MVRRTKDEALETRNCILDTAERVFSERGVSRTSLNDIAAAAGMTRGAIYWHFQDKADLFCSMVARVTLPMEDAPCQVDHAGATDPLGSIRSMMVTILKRIAEDAQARRVFHIVFHKCEYVAEMKPVWKRFSDMQVGCLKSIERGIAEAIARGQLPGSTDSRMAALGLHAMIDGLMSKWASDLDHRPPTADIEHLVDLFLNALRHPTVVRPASRTRNTRSAGTAMQRKRRAAATH